MKKNIEERQLEMRKRNAETKLEKGLSQATASARGDSPEVLGLKKQISELKAQVLALQVENNRLRQQEKIVVERPQGPQRSYVDPVKEQQHNFFKYSNARRRY